MSRSEISPESEGIGVLFLPNRTTHIPQYASSNCESQGRKHLMNTSRPSLQQSSLTGGTTASWHMPDPKTIWQRRNPSPCTIEELTELDSPQSSGRWIRSKQPFSMTIFSACYTPSPADLVSSEAPQTGALEGAVHVLSTPSRLTIFPSLVENLPSRLQGHERTVCEHPSSAQQYHDSESC